MSTTLVHVGVRASDLQATIRFWRDGLGLPVFSQQENCYDLSDGFHAARVIGVWVSFYNTERPHSALTGILRNNERR